MADHHDYLALDWVRGEIQETLNQAQQALESFVENPADTSRMQFCQTYLHQVHGTLKIVEFYGAALLAEEMEQLAEALLNDTVVDGPAAQEVLMRAILQLPPYLDRIQSGRHDLPLVLLPLLNDMRSVRGEKLLSETSLFNPDLSSIVESFGAAPAADDDGFVPLVRKLRQMYQLALLGVLRENDLTRQYHFLETVLKRLEQVTGNAGLAPLWAVSGALLEALQNEAVELSISVKMLLGKVDRVLRELTQDGAERLEQIPPVELLKNLLYYVAKSSGQTPRVAQVRRYFRLDEALPSEERVHAERERMSGPDQSTISSVVAALSEELTKVKNALERYANDADEGSSQLEEEIAGLKQISDTLAVLGLAPSRDVVNQQIEALRDLVASDSTRDFERLMSVASELLMVEEGLNRAADKQYRNVAGSAPEHVDQAREAVLRECRTDLEEAKDGIVEYIASQWNKTHLAEVPAKLNTVRGGLELVQLRKPASILQQCARFITDKLLADDVGKPDWRSMDTLADAIASVEYYLERLTDEPETRDDILHIASQSVGELGYPVEEFDALSAETEDSAPPEEESELPVIEDVVADKPALTLDFSTEVAELPEAELDRPLDQPVVLHDAPENAIEFDLPELTTDTEETDDGSLSDSGVDSLELPDLDLPVVENIAASEAAQYEEADEEDDLIDDEIIEIFTEEAGEVIEALNEYFPRWAQNTNDQEALTEFRRAFHTLKGSGRMVGAITVGELAWSVENMMNRVIDKTIVTTPVLIELVRRVHGLIPQLVEDFAQRRPASFNVQPLMSAADHLAEGGSIDEVPSLDEPAAIVAEAADVADVTVDVLPEVELEIDQGVELATDSVVQDEEDEAEETLLDIFILEAFANLKDLEDWVASLDRDFHQHHLDDLVHRVMHTIKGSSRMAELECIAEIAEPAEKSVKELINIGQKVNDDFLELLERAIAVIEQALNALRAGETLPEHLDDSQALIDEFVALRQHREGGDSIDKHLLMVFMSEGMDIILDSEDLLNSWIADQSNIDGMVSLTDELSLLSGSAKTAGLNAVSAMSDVLSRCYASLATGKRTADDHFLDLARAGQEALINMMDCMAAGQTVDPADALRQQLDDWLVDNIINDAQAFDQDVVVEPVLPDVEVLAPDDEIENIDFAEMAEPEVMPEPASTEATEDKPAVGQQLLDDELGEIFIEEAIEVLERSEEILSAWQNDRNKARVAELQRNLHTLKGGARMAGISYVGDLAHELEFIYEAIALQQRKFSFELDVLLTRCHDRLASMIDQLKDGQAIFPADDLLQAIRSLREETEGSAATVEVVDEADAVETGAVELDVVEQGAAETVALDDASDDVLTAQDIDGVLETDDTAAVSDEDIALDDLDDDAILVDEAELLADNDAITALLEDVSLDRDSVLPASGDSDVEPSLPVVDVEESVSSPDEAAASRVAVSRDPELVAIFLEEAEEIVGDSSEALESWLEAPDNLSEVQTLQRYLHTLKGGARMAEVSELGDLAHELENLYEGLSNKRLSYAPVLVQLLQRCHDRIEAMVEALKKDDSLTAATDLQQQIHDYIANPAEFKLADLQQPVAAKAESEAALSTEAAADDATAPATFELPGDLDASILDVFMEEAADISDQLGGLIQQWKDADGAGQALAELKRALHTLKGGARLAGLKELGDWCHESETLLDTGKVQPTAEVVAQFEALDSNIADLLKRVRETVAAQAASTDKLVAKSDVASSAVATPAATPAVQKAPVEGLPGQHKQREQTQTQQPQEMVRIGADVLETLVNLAGETSINRGRVEQGVSRFVNHIAEMGNTVERLYGQLRRLDIETEAQILSNYKQGVESGQYGDDFDPLEMDQYSELHQITKQLSESASDLLDLKNTLIDSTRDTETLLLQQSRINTELQEKLMRTRMVPFSRLVPRLRRIVRQVAGELNKQVDFEVINPEGELDRALMERIVAPLEHMLRNAVDHGVETPDKRKAAGKSEKGTVTLEMGRDGGDVLLVLSDDGAGINVEAVKKKALERGLVKADSALTDQEMMQFIFSAGFSTAEKVTQVSGRGVGMDVVASEIKQMGGSVVIDSHPGEGTRFVVRLPFTVAMNRALLVRAGDDSYAIPLAQVEGIVRVSPYELEAYLGKDAEDYNYAGQSYHLDYLGQYVHGIEAPNLDNVMTPFPVLLLHSQDHQVALVVDSLIGSREVVVKSVGPQLSSVAGISGATILGDGSVVIILDIHSLIRAAFLERKASIDAPHQPGLPEPEEEAKEVQPLIMVTDDSVTVRKVTTRLLERNGFEVVTAKDGMDAVAKLEERRPDLMLLDIEMPRMDGFEVASHMRHDSRFVDVPIIMITSRTGDKHRERAFEIGVNAYLGKPFQEGELLAGIRELLALEK